MILTKEQLNKRINSEGNIANKNHSSQVEVRTIGVNNPNGKGQGTRNLTPEERVSIGTLGHFVPDEVVADIFGISESHANDLKNASRNVGAGEHGTSQRIKDAELQKQIKERLDKTKLSIQERAAETLLNSMGLIDSPENHDKLKNANPKELAEISVKMSQVMKNMSSQGSEGSEGKKGVKIVLHQPKTSSESNFETVEIGVIT